MSRFLLLAHEKLTSLREKSEEIHHQIELPFVRRRRQRKAGFHRRMMHCTCSERNQWISNERNLSSSVTFPRKSHETLTGSVLRSSLKSSSRPLNSVTPKKSVDIRSEPRFSTLPRSRARSRPHVTTIFNETAAHYNQRPRRQSEVIPWHQQQPLKCTCRSSCYFCNLNYPQVNYPLSASTNALGYYYPYSTLSLNNPNYCHQSQYNLSTEGHQYIPSRNYPQFPSHHHHSMINLTNKPVLPTDPSIVEQLLAESPSPTMSNSPVPAPPAPPLNPSCARCRFTSSVEATSTGTIHCHPTATVGSSNPHAHSSQTSYPGTSKPGSAYTGKFKLLTFNLIVLFLFRDHKVIIRLNFLLRSVGLLFKFSRSKLSHFDRFTFNIWTCEKLERR